MAGATTLAGAALATTPLSAYADDVDVSTVEATNIATFRHVIDRGLNHGDLTIFDTVLAPHMVDHQIYGLNWPTGVKAIRAAVTTLRRAFPDLCSNLADVAASGDRVFGRAITTGTFTGNYLGIPGNGHKIYIEIHDEFLFEHLSAKDMQSRAPRIVEHWGVSDNLTLLLELGLIPAKALPSYKG